MRPLRSIALSSIAVLALAAGANAMGSSPSASAVSGKSITRIKVVRSVDSTHVNSVNFVDLPGGQTSIVVPANMQAVLLVRFSAETQCAVPRCHVRIVANDIEMEPAAGLDFAFDGGIDADDEVESNSMDRSIGPVGAGTYVIKVQVATSVENGNPITFEVDDWSLTVERVKV